MSQRFVRSLAMLALVFAGAVLALLFMQGTPRVARGAAALSPTVRHTVLNVSCVSAPMFDSTFTKITDIGNFTVESGDSAVEVTYQGRVNVDTLVGATGSVFELRVDNLASTVGRARAHINTVGSQGEHVTFSGIFLGLEPGAHTVSVGCD